MSSHIDNFNDAAAEYDIVLPITDDYRDSIFNFSLPQEDRLQALNRLNQEYPDETIEVVKKIMSVYLLSGMSLLKRFMYDVALHSNLPLLFRLDCSRTLCDHDRSRDLGLQSLVALCESLHDIPVVYALDNLLYLYNSGSFPEKAHPFLLEFLLNPAIECTYRYKTILGLPTSLTTNGEETMKECCLAFVKLADTALRYRILGCQNLLAACALGETERCFVEDLLFSFARDETLETNARADAVDILLRLADKERVREAESLLKQLGGQALHIYDNQQNAHMKEIEKSALETIRYIDTCSIQPIPSFEVVEYNLKELAKRRFRSKTRVQKDRHVKTNVHDYIEREFYDVYDETLSEEEKNIEMALLRIQLDRTSFHEINYSLCDVLLRLYAYIQHQEIHKTAMEDRLLEELIDMQGTCTTGYINRLVNTLSGFGQHSLSISWEDQITANLTGRLNARIRETVDEKERDTILEEMTNPKIEDRLHFNTFFIQHISAIKEEMYNEFRHYLQDSEWDLYMKKALMNYQVV